jgi:uncharacterized repeat protein (TIGR01451 family)
MVSSPTTDPGPGTNTATQDTDVITQANIDMTKDETTDPVTAGNQNIYILRVTNHGPSDALDVQAFDNLPPELSGARYCIGQGCFNFDQPWTGSIGLGTMGPEGTEVVRIRATVAASTPPSPPRIVNTASATTTTEDPNLDRNTNTERTDVITRADVSITKTVSSHIVQVGGLLTYVLNVTNSGPSDAQSVTVTDDVAQWAGKLSSPRYCLGSGCVPATGNTWTGSVGLGTLAPGATRQIRIDTTPSQAAGSDISASFGPQVPNSASVTSGTTDTNPGNNSDSDGTTKICTQLGDEGANTLPGTSGNDLLCGRGGNDTLRGQSGNDVLEADYGDRARLGGAGGVDSLEGGPGNDVLSGDGGSDTATYQNVLARGVPVRGIAIDLNNSTENDAQGTDTIMREESSPGQPVAGDSTVENVVGSNFNDELTGDETANALAGNGCANANAECTGIDDSYYTFHASGRDQGGDVLHGQGGNDTLTGNVGNDALRGGDGDDTLNGGSNHDLLAGEAGNDTINGGGDLDIVWYLSAPATVRVNLSNTTRTFAGGGVGAHRATGEGVDVLGTDIENIKGSNNADGLFGDDGTNSIDGSAGNDSIFGFGANDRSDAVGIGWQPPPNGPVSSTNQFPGLSGGAGNDTINGGDGNDLLVGGTGTDGATGGQGADICYERESGTC